MKFIFSDQGTAAHPSPGNWAINIEPPINNVHYNWCRDNVGWDRCRIDFAYPYYDIIIHGDDATAFKLKFEGCTDYE